MKKNIINKMLALLVCSSFSAKSQAQFQLLDTRAVVDTLSFKERVSFHFNAVDFALQTPNLDVEYDLRGTNWGKWSVLAGFKFNLPVWNKVNPFIVLDNKEAHFEVRKYWRSRKSRLSTVYYWGIRGAYSNYDFKLTETGNRGKAWFGGISIGTIRQLYGYPSGNSLDLELGLTLGAAYANNTKYHRDENKEYVVDEVKDWNIVKYPVVNEIRAGLIYRFGNFPISRKYRSRYDTDMVFRNAYEDHQARMRKIAMDKRMADSLFNMSYKYYQEKYDSIYKVVLREEKEAKARAKEQLRLEKIAKAEAKKAEALNRKQEKIRLKNERDAQKKAENESRKQAARQEELLKKQQKELLKGSEEESKNN